MFLSIISIVAYFAALIFGIAEENAKGKLIAVGTAVLSLVNFYMVCSSRVSSYLLLNIVLGAIHLAAFLFALLMLIPGKPKSQKEEKKDASHFDAKIVDNGDRYTDQPTPKAPESELVRDVPKEDKNICLLDVHLGDDIICDIRGEKADFKITVDTGGKKYEFYIQNGQTVAYRTGTMTQPESY